MVRVKAYLSEVKKGESRSKTRVSFLDHLLLLNQFSTPSVATQRKAHWQLVVAANALWLFNHYINRGLPGIDQAGTGDQSSIHSSISNREKTESRRGQLSSKGLAGRRRASLFVLLYIYAWFRSTLPSERPLPESGRGRKEVGRRSASYRICNRLNLETFFEPIIDFIEIGKPRGLPLWEPYMRISSRTAQAERPKYWLQRICNRKFETS